MARIPDIGFVFGFGSICALILAFLDLRHRRPPQAQIDAISQRPLGPPNQ